MVTTLHLLRSNESSSLAGSTYRLLKWSRLSVRYRPRTEIPHQPLEERVPYTKGLGEHRFETKELRVGTHGSCTSFKQAFLLQLVSRNKLASC